MNASQFFEIAVSLQIQVLLVVMSVALLDRLVNNAAASCRLWTIGFLSIIALIAASLLIPHVRLFDVGHRISDSSTARNLFALQVWIVKAVAVVWVIGLTLNLIRRLGRCIILMRFLDRRCRLMTRDEIASLPLTHDDVLPNNLRWLVSTEKHAPFCWQMHRPTLVLPTYILAQESRVLRHVLLHELEHLRTNHPVQHFLQGVCNSLLWFHPAVWWAAKRAELTREFHCDEVSAKSCGAVGSYLRTLAMVAEQNTEAPDCTLAFGRRKHAIIRRTERLIAHAKSNFNAGRVQTPWRSRVAIGCLLVAVTTISQIWLPVNVLASSRSRLSPWPSWSAERLHDFGISVRDYEPFDELHDLLVEDED